LLERVQHELTRFDDEADLRQRLCDNSELRARFRQALFDISMLVPRAINGSACGKL
jgi:hypothetical protein